MNRRHEALEVDFLRFYGLDLPRQLGTRRLTWRRFALLVRALPRESVTVELETEGRSRWSDTDYLLAAILDAENVGNWQRARAHFKGSPPAPNPIGRPGRTKVPPGRTELTPDEMARRLVAQRRRLNGR